ncbi:DUF3800 domain-containing protein [uncultured Alistipes sp.]|uniref:DUF3800 domain-containing protein n=1 Tax=uncultured Alistipes sp. TaxID=538949 RepID=UPI00259BB84A|nr:DUF3800 domain-containing protein [uncultured Alistipes sp.]
MVNLYAFIDEFGNNGLDFTNPQISSHFIVTAIIVEENDIPILETLCTEIRQKYFQGSEIKSSKVGKNHERRKRILENILDGKFNVYTLVVDKKHLYSEGFKYKKSFYKFLNGLLYHELFRRYPLLQIVADEIGHNSYMSSFKRYVQNRHKPDLFSYSSFGFSNSKSSSLVQIADFIGGTLARRYDSTVYEEEADLYLKMMDRHLLPIKYFPNNYEPYIYNATDVEGFDELIASTAINLALHFINDNHNTSDENIIEQVKCLEYLVFYFRYIDPTRYVSTQELISKNLKKKTSQQYFRSNIIAKLRDSGVIISSSSLGYKMPMNKKDIYDFVNHSSSIINPMIERLRKARNTILQVSRNKIDILAEDEYKGLRKMVQLFDENIH